MAGGGNFIGRVMQYLVNELLVDRLANNQSFQRFAVRSSRAIEEMAQKGVQTKEELTRNLKGYSEAFGQENHLSMMMGAPQSLQKSFKAFGILLINEIERHLKDPTKK